MEILDNTAEPPKIRVVVRQRPLNIKELKRNDSAITEVPNENHLILKELK